MAPLRDVMNQGGWTVRRLAKEAGVAPSTIHYLSRGREGKTQTASPDTIRRLSVALGIDAFDVDEFAAVFGAAGLSRPNATPDGDRTGEEGGG